MDIQLRVPERQGLLSWQYPWSWGSTSALDWTLHLSDQIPLTLEIDAFAGELTLALNALKITDLKIRVKSSDAHISLPDREGITTVNIDTITANLMIQVPSEGAFSIHNEMVMGVVEGDLPGLPMTETERHYESANYHTATKRADIRMGGNMGTVEFI